MAGDEAKADGIDLFGVGLFGVEGCDGPLAGCVLPIKLLARARGQIV